MASGGSDRDAEYALSKLLLIGTVAEYQNEFEILINRVTGIKLELQREPLRTRPTTLGEAFSLALSLVGCSRSQIRVKTINSLSNYQDGYRISLKVV
ncbi:hypothetical protein Tco_1044404 [Tanacetum coccineum]|uniref:Uncharacterized protein n=1 Tax=Tanacetum coccineum TaxID=301880 RepID=A0ABQ5GQD5_9ASTR